MAGPFFDPACGVGDAAPAGPFFGTASGYENKNGEAENLGKKSWGRESAGTLAPRTHQERFPLWRTGQGGAEEEDADGGEGRWAAAVSGVCRRSEDNGFRVGASRGARAVRGHQRGPATGPSTVNLGRFRYGSDTTAVLARPWWTSMQCDPTWMRRSSPCTNAGEQAACSPQKPRAQGNVFSF